jgi:hypothetical protein
MKWENYQVWGIGRELEGGLFEGIIPIQSSQETEEKTKNIKAVCQTPCP